MTPRRRSAAFLAPSLFAAAGLLAAVPASAAVYVYGCVLNPRQEVPMVAAGPLGGGRFVIDTDANTVTYRIAYSGLTSSESAAHIHGFAPPGIGANVLVSLPAGNPKVGVWNYLESQEANILAGMTYANVHTSNNPGGEIRGQITPLNALMDAAQEVPTNASTAKGWAVAMIDTVTNQLTYYVSYEGLSSAEIAAHFHGNSLQGTGAGVKIALPGTPSPKSGTAAYLEADQDAILSGQWYVNIHTSNNPGGEIRGQLVPLVIPMDPLQEVPQILTAPTTAGFGLVAIDTVANVLGFDVREAGLSSAETAAHIHGFAPPTANATVLQALPAGTQKLGTWAYGSANEGNVLAGLTYFNVHTTLNSGGEMRGQIENLPGSASVLAVGDDGPRHPSGLAAAPNPSGGRTLLTYQLSRSGQVSLSIVGVDGRVVRSEPAALFAPGPHTYEWDGRDNEGRAAPPGMYFAIVRTPDGERVTRLARLR